MSLMNCRTFGIFNSIIQLCFNAQLSLVNLRHQQEKHMPQDLLIDLLIDRLAMRLEFAVDYVLRNEERDQHDFDL